MKKSIITLMFLSALGACMSLQAQNYDNAVGLRVGWGFGADFKHFLSEESALEAIVNFRRVGVLGFGYTYIQVTGLYEIHKPLEDVAPGLQWYFGGGGFVGFGKTNVGVLGSAGEANTSIGVLGVIGLDYAFEDIPLNVSLDWMPGISLTGGSGFFGRTGGLAVRYIF